MNARLKMWQAFVARGLACPVIAIAISMAMVVASAAHAADKPAAAAAKLAQGQKVFTYWCATCHSAGPGMPGTQALQAKYKGKPPALLLERKDLTAPQIAVFVRNGVSVMAQFRKTEISDSDLDALTTYIVATAKAKR
jgi:mono/diheme cytochrome c family protein